MTAASLPAAFPVTLVGHPFATVGMGEQLRSHIAACQAVHLPHAVLDIYRYASRSDPDHRKLVGNSETNVPSGGIRIFHVNGDEVESVIRAFEARGGTFADGYNIIVPAWELPEYPLPWAEQLRKFNEIWALSAFIKESLAAVGLSSLLIGQAVEVPLGHFLPRKYFGIKESAFTILHFFDLSSFASRKNPNAVLDMYEAIKAKREYEDIQLVLKVKKGDEDGEEWIAPLRDRVPEACFLSKPMSSLETRSLINCCDCFVSLHRAEGFGRGTGEAMFMGRLAMATAWSGNLDYMTKENSLLVDYDLIPVGADEYPFGKNQRWANARVSHAVELLDAAIGDLEATRIMAANGRRTIRMDHGYRAVGVRVLDRVSAIIEFMSIIEKPLRAVAIVEEASIDGVSVGDDAPADVVFTVQETLIEVVSPVDETPADWAVAEESGVSETIARPVETQAPSITPFKRGRKAPSARTRKRLGRMDQADPSLGIAERVKEPAGVAD